MSTPTDFEPLSAPGFSTHNLISVICLLFKNNFSTSYAIFSTKKKEEFSTKFTIDLPIFL